MIDPAADLPGDLPALDRPLGDLDHPLARAVRDGFEVVGRRARVTGTADRIDTVWAGSVVVQELGLRGATPAVATESPLGVTRALDTDHGPVVERVVVSRDAPVAWVEWMCAGEPRSPTGKDGSVELEWTVPAAREGSAVGRDGRAITVWDHSGARALFLLSAEPAAVTTEAGAAGSSFVRVRAPLPLGSNGGLRLAIVGIGPGDDPARLLRIAGRTAVAVRGREGAAARLLADGLTVVSPEPGLDEAVARARLRFDSSRMEPAPGGLGPDESGPEVLARLAGGDFTGVRSFLNAIAAEVAASPAEDGRRSLFRFLAARYLAWSGDRAGVRSAGEAAGIAVAEDGDHDVATPAGIRPAEPDSEPVRWVVETLLGTRPDALRGRLVLRPRLPEDWARLEVRGLAAGSAAVDVVYRRDGAGHRFTLSQRRGGVPLQAVLEPELPGGRVRVARVDGSSAELDPVRVDGRWRVPVQLVLDHPRTLEVEFGPDSL